MVNPKGIPEDYERINNSGAIWFRKCVPHAGVLREGSIKVRGEYRRRWFAPKWFARLNKLRMDMHDLPISDDTLQAFTASPDMQAALLAADNLGALQELVEQAGMARKARSTTSPLASTKKSP